MNGEKSAKTAPRSQKAAKAQVSTQRKMKDPSFKNAQSGSSKDRQAGQRDSGKELQSAGQQGKRPGKCTPGAAVEGQRSPGAQRKLSDASNASEDLSKDSGCLSGKLSSSDSSSEMSDCPSEGNKQDSPSSDNELSWIDGGAHVRPDSGAPCAKAARGGHAPPPGAADGGLSLFSSSGSVLDLMMGETTDDLVREVDDLKSENEYLKVSFSNLLAVRITFV